MISLSELARLDAARTQGEWIAEFAGDPESPSECIVSDGTPGTFLAIAVDEPDARAIVAVINALAPLLRVARAAMAYREAERSVRPSVFDNRCMRARADLDAALKEVEP